MRITHNEVHEIHPDRWTVRLHKTLDDGTVEEGCHVMPKDILEWRAGEYGIDPADVDTLLDIVLMEPYLTPEDWATGYQLHNAPDIATARKDHIARCARAKLRHRISTRGASNGSPAGLTAAAAGHPLDVIRRDHGIDREVVAVKAEHVARIREHTAQQAARAAADLGLSRAERLRRELGLDDAKKGGRR